MKKLNMALAAAALIGAAGTAPALARDEIRIVGSSTVYPFSTVVAERFGKTTAFKTPVVESTGTGGGFKLFCSGAGENTPDISNASRAIKSSEIELCATNGVTEIVEVKVGYDGIVVANAKGANHFEFSTRDLFLALAKDIPDENGNLTPNTAKTWKDINPALPAMKIEVLGPPPTSGTRDAFAELAMESGCKSFAWIKDLKKSDKSKYKAICHSIREDGAYIEAGENDNLIVQKLVANENALGIFGFSFLDQNSDKVQASTINGTEATFDNIADGSYAVSRPLFFYVKKAHVGVISGLEEFVLAFIADEATGEDGYLADRGLIPMSADEHAAQAAKVRNFEPLTH
ncbi:MAG: PstS family phosphate ABC transporter substrate-binding protein [Alphaproteobacteria bacterium]|nr:MAG: PstS family phosphate ABC transporter substrate-binding protein [Alphaproteobacteria bacterium]